MRPTATKPSASLPLPSEDNHEAVDSSPGAPEAGIATEDAPTSPASPKKCPELPPELSREAMKHVGRYGSREDRRNAGLVCKDWYAGLRDFGPATVTTPVLDGALRPNFLASNEVRNARIYHSRQLDDSLVMVLPHNPKLMHLDLSHNSGIREPHSLTTISEKFPNVDCLDLYCAGPASLEALESSTVFPKMSRLIASYHTEENVVRLLKGIEQHGKNLCSLGLGDTGQAFAASLGRQGLAPHIATHCPNLERLALCFHTDLSAEDLSTLVRKLPKLQELTISSNSQIEVEHVVEAMRENPSLHVTMLIPSDGTTPEWADFVRNEHDLSDRVSWSRWIRDFTDNELRISKSRLSK